MIHSNEQFHLTFDGMQYINCPYKKGMTGYITNVQCNIDVVDGRFRISQDGGYRNTRRRPFRCVIESVDRDMVYVQSIDGTNIGSPSYYWIRFTPDSEIKEILC
jgi:hypothetical protein